MALSSQSNAYHNKHLALKANVGKKSSPKILFGQVEIGGSSKEKTVKVKIGTAPKKGTTIIKARAKRKLSGATSPLVTQALVEELLASRAGKRQKAKTARKSTNIKVVSSPKVITKAHSSEKTIRASKDSSSKKRKIAISKDRKAVETKKDTLKKAIRFRADKIVKKAKPIIKKATFLNKKKTLASPTRRTAIQKKTLASPTRRTAIQKKTLTSPTRRTAIQKKTLTSPAKRTIMKKALVSPKTRTVVQQKAESSKAKMARTSFRVIKKTATAQKSSAAKKNVVKKATNKARKTYFR